MKIEGETTSFLKIKRKKSIRNESERKKIRWTHATVNIGRKESSTMVPGQLALTMVPS